MIELPSVKLGSSPEAFVRMGRVLTEGILAQHTIELLHELGANISVSSCCCAKERVIAGAGIEAKDEIYEIASASASGMSKSPSLFFMVSYILACAKVYVE